mgnify:CR=1 FL=1|jgi:hypothetical protein
MEYKEFEKKHNPLQGDPLVAWFDDPNTTDEEIIDFLGLEFFKENLPVHEHSIEGISK